MPSGMFRWGRGHAGHVILVYRCTVAMYNAVRYNTVQSQCTMRQCWIMDVRLHIVQKKPPQNNEEYNILYKGFRPGTGPNIKFD